MNREWFLVCDTCNTGQWHYVENAVCQDCGEDTRCIKWRETK